MMQFTVKTQSVTQVLLALAQQGPYEPLAVDGLCGLCDMREQQISVILDQCLQRGLVQVTAGGFVLAWHPQDISLRCIVRVGEECADKCQCEGKSEDTCQVRGTCRARRIRNVVQVALDDALESISLYDFMTMGNGL